MRSELSLPVRLGYGSGDFAVNLAYQTISLYLIYYFTDVFGIPPYAAGLVFLVSKLWDAVSDPIMGSLVDRTRTRWGQKRPYLLFGAIPFGLTVALLFASPDLPPVGRILYGLAAYILFCTAVTVVNIPHGALTASLSRDSDERLRISTYRMTFSLIGTLVAASVTLPLVGGFADERSGFRAVGMIYGAIGAAVVLTAFLAVRGHDRPDPIRPPAGLREALKEMATVLRVNRPFLVLAGSTIIILTGVNIVAAAAKYYFKYVLDRESAVPLALGALFVTAVFFIPLIAFISRRSSKRNGYLFGLVIFAAALFGLFFPGSGRLVPVVGLCVIAGIGMAAIYLSPWSMIPDTVEYSQWRSGLRREGILYGFFFFCFKLGSALAGFVIGTVLDLVGYVPNAAQSASTVLGIRLLMSFIPALLVTAGIAVLLLYPIDREMHRRMLADIAGRTESTPA